MADERLESSKQGIAAPPESPIAKKADAERERRLIEAPESTRPDSAMGGTSDVDSPGDEAALDALRAKER